MPTSAYISLQAAATPLHEPVTKFGGQPVWVDTPEWPNSQETGDPMRFICQIRLDPRIFGGDDSHMAYLFMTDEEEYIDSTWEPDGGENALIIQKITSSSQATEGPTLPEEYVVHLSIRDDPPFVEEGKRFDWSEEEASQYGRRLEGNKIGGTPYFLQGDEFPARGPWDLLLQLDSTKVPFSINFGDAGVGYAFISKDRRQGKFLWQCC